MKPGPGKHVGPASLLLRASQGLSPSPKGSLWSSPRCKETHLDISTSGIKGIKDRKGLRTRSKDRFKPFATDPPFGKKKGKEESGTRSVATNSPGQNLAHLRLDAVCFRTLTNFSQP